MKLLIEVNMKPTLRGLPDVLPNYEHKYCVRHILQYGRRVAKVRNSSLFSGMPPKHNENDFKDPLEALKLESAKCLEDI